MTDQSRERISQVLRYVPAVHRTSREATLIAFVLFTLVSLTVFWTELLVEHGMAGEPGAQVLGWAMNGIAVLFCIWLASAAASYVIEVWPR